MNTKDRATEIIECYRAAVKLLDDNARHWEETMFPLLGEWHPELDDDEIYACIEYALGA